VRALVITNLGHVLDAETGADLAQLVGGEGRNEANWGSGFVAAAGDLVFKTWGGDCSPPPCQAWQLAATGSGAIEVEARPSIPFSNSHGPFALSDRVLVLGGKGGQRLLDPRTGREIGTVPGGTASIAGSRLILATNLVGGNGREREDQMCLASFAVVDVSDPAQPRVLAKQSLLGSAAAPVDVADACFPEVARDPKLKLLTIGGYHGVAGEFGVRLGGVTCHGSRLYILSNTHLYCIAEGGKS
jgi:hypothetical protein